MPVKDISSDLEVSLNTAVSVSGDGQVTGDGVDTADFGEGAMFAALVTAYTDGDHAIGAQESDDNGASDPWTDVAAEKLIVSDTDDNVASELTADGAAMAKVGFFSTKRYVRPTVDSTGVTTGADLTLLTVMKGELLPV